MKDLKERKASDNKAKAITGRKIHKRKQMNCKREKHGIKTKGED